MRAENIRRNRERMAQLRLPPLAQQVAPKPKPKKADRPRGLARAAAKPKPAGPTRRSLRRQGRDPDGALAQGVDRERRDGTVVLVAGEAIRVPAALQTWETQKKERLAGDVPFAALNAAEGDDATDAAFVRALAAAATADATVSLAKRKKREELLGAPAYAALALAEDDVAKVVKRGVTFLQFLPRPDARVVCCGDKEGHVGFWNFGAEGRALGEDGVVLTKPHTSYMSGLVWPKATPGAVYTCSYDGQVRRLDVGKGVFESLVDTEDNEFSAFAVNSAGTAAYVADNVGNLFVADPRAKALAGNGLHLHDRKINTVDLEPVVEQLLVTACSGAQVNVWDVRKLRAGAKPLQKFPHAKSCQAAHFCPDGSRRILTTCYDNTLNCLATAPGGAGTWKVRHNNQTGRWLSPLRAIWTPDGSGALCGSMKREVEVFDGQTGQVLARHDSEHQTAVSSRVCAHPFAPLIASGTASGRVHLYSAGA